MSSMSLLSNQPLSNLCKSTYLSISIYTSTRLSSKRLTFNITAKVNEKEKIIASQRRLIVELKEGAYILEGQLRLMDEKYYELRCKLDTARANQRHAVKRAEDIARDLRKKFTVIHGPRVALDSVVVREHGLYCILKGLFLCSIIVMFHI